MEGDAKSEAKGRNIEYHGVVERERWGVGGQGVLPWMGPPMDLRGSPSSGDAHAALLSASSSSDPSLITPAIVPLLVPLCSSALSPPVPSSLRQPPGDPVVQ